MKRCLWMVPLLCALTSCDQMGPGDAVYLFGSFTRPDGGVGPLEVAVQRSSGELEPENPRFEPVFTLQTREDGALAMEVTAEEVWGGPEIGVYGALNRWRLVPLGPSAGLTVTFETTGDAELPPLQLGDLTASVDPELRLFFSLPERPVLPLSASYRDTAEEPNPTALAPVLELLSGDHPLWLDFAPASGMSLAAVLEDFPAEGRVRAVSVGRWSHLPLLAPSSSFVQGRFEWRAGVSPAPGERIPASRGVPCGAAPCPFTDGDLARIVLAEEVYTVELTFPGPVRPGEVVLRGLELEGWGTFRVEGRTGAGWLPLMEGRYGAVPTSWAIHHWPADSALDAPIPFPGERAYARARAAEVGEVTAVRLSAQSSDGEPLRLVALQELSVFAAE